MPLMLFLNKANRAFSVYFHNNTNEITKYYGIFLQFSSLKHTKKILNNKREKKGKLQYFT